MIIFYNGGVPFSFDYSEHCMSLYIESLMYLLAAIAQYDTKQKNLKRTYKNITVQRCRFRPHSQVSSIVCIPAPHNLNF